MSIGLNFSSDNTITMYQINYRVEPKELVFNHAISDKNDLQLLFFKIYDNDQCNYKNYYGVQILYYDYNYDIWNLTGTTMITSDKIKETIDNFELYTGKSTKPQFISLFLNDEEYVSLYYYTKKIVLKRG